MHEDNLLNLQKGLEQLSANMSEELTALMDFAQAQGKIIVAIAACDPRVDNDFGDVICALCNATMGPENRLEEHDPDCPWRQAVEFQQAKDAAPPSGGKSGENACSKPCETAENQES